VVIKLIDQENIEFVRTDFVHRLREENLKEDPIPPVLKLIDHFEEYQGVKAIQKVKRIIIKDITRIILPLAVQFVYLLFLIFSVFC
jgi:hypothetical protein